MATPGPPMAALEPHAIVDGYRRHGDGSRRASAQSRVPR